MEENKKLSQSFINLYEVCKKLRSPQGCPWDKSQTPQSMRTCLKEEIFEVIDAIDSNDAGHVKEEIGDSIFNLLLTALMYEENADFKISEVLDDVAEKLIRRHPHVFNRENSNDEVEVSSVNRKWDEIKTNVEGRKTECVLDSVPQGFSPLLKSYKYLKKASKKGFVWNDANESKEKLLEEINEVQEAENQHEKEIECGDMLLAAVDFCIMNDVDPELALNRANKKFYNRFSYVERGMKENQHEMKKENVQEMLILWSKAKEIFPE